MKILQIALLIIAIYLCNSDPVQCQAVQASTIGYFTTCSSTKPFPLKVSTTVTLTQRYGFSPTKSWRFSLRNYKGQITAITNCTSSSPADSTYNPGTNLTVGFTCYELPRQLQEADVIQISFFDDYSSFRLVYLVPIIGYSMSNQIKIHEDFDQIPKALQEQNKNHQISQNIQLVSPQNFLNDIVDCYGVQDSILGRYSSCSSSKPFPLKVQTTVTMTRSYGFDPKSSWKFNLRSYKGQVTKIEGCIVSNPAGGFYNPGNISFGFMCSQLPRQLQEGDYIQITFFADTSNKLVYLIPIISYSQMIDVQQQKLKSMNRIIPLKDQIRSRLPFQLTKETNNQQKMNLRND